MRSDKARRCDYIQRLLCYAFDWAVQTIILFIISAKDWTLNIARSTKKAPRNPSLASPSCSYRVKTALKSRPLETRDPNCVRETKRPTVALERLPHRLQQSTIIPASCSTHHSRFYCPFYVVAYCSFCAPPRMADESMEIDGAPSAPTSNHNLYYTQPDSFTPQGA